MRTGTRGERNKECSAYRAQTKCEMQRPTRLSRLTDLDLQFVHLLRGTGKPLIDDEEVEASDFPNGDASVHQSRACAAWMRAKRPAIAGFRKALKMAPLSRKAHESYKRWDAKMMPRRGPVETH